MNLTLYQITQEQARLNAMLEESGGELTPEIEEALAINAENLQVKAGGYGVTILKYEAMADAAAAEIKRIQAIKKTCDNIVERMKKTLVQAMQNFEIDRVDTDTMKLSLRKNSCVIIDDEKKVPADCKKIKVDISKADLKEHIKKGEDCGAHIGTNYSLQIR
jgi:hypothetical protein